PRDVVGVLVAIGAEEHEPVVAGVTHGQPERLAAAATLLADEAHPARLKELHGAVGGAAIHHQHLVHRAQRQLGKDVGDAVDLVEGEDDEGGHRTAAAAASRTYHSIVRVRPSRRPTEASNPKALRAIETSAQRRRWPLGLLASKASRPRKPVISAISAASSRTLISKPAPRFTGSSPS